MASTAELTQPAPVHHLRIGEVVVTAINDGMFEIPFEAVIGLARQEAERLHRAAFRTLPLRLTLNAFLLRLEGHLALVDTGYGPHRGPSVGKLLGHLRGMGVAPGDIDTVLLTHMHRDHACGLVDADGNAVFPRAEVVVHATEARYWFDDGAMAQATDRVKEIGRTVRAAVAPYRDRFRTVADGVALPGISALLQPGHTPGHTAWVVESAGDALQIWGDTVHVPSIQLAAPHAAMLYDTDPAGAVASRRRALAAAAEARLRVAGTHLDFPGFGYVVRAGEGYALVPEFWTPTV